MRGSTVDGDAASTGSSTRGSRPTRPLHEPEGFRALLNSFLPRKRAIGQMLVRDPRRPGAAVPADLQAATGTCPAAWSRSTSRRSEAVAREVEEELGLELAAGPLLLTDWLPPWSGWDDALCLVFDGGVHDAVARSTTIVRRRARSGRREFCTLDEVRERCADFTARRIESALANARRAGGPAYTESGRS